MELTGIISVIKDEQQVSANFKKREVVITTEEQYPQSILIEFHQDKCNSVDNRKVGDKVKIAFNLRGRIWTNPQGEDKYFNTIQGWRVELLSEGTKQTQNSSSDPSVPVAMGDDDLQF